MRGAIVRCAVQDVRDSKGKVARDSPVLTPRPLRTSHRLSGVHQGRLRLARNLTAKDVEDVGDPEGKDC